MKQWFMSLIKLDLDLRSVYFVDSTLHARWHGEGLRRRSAFKKYRDEDAGEKKFLLLLLHGGHWGGFPSSRLPKGGAEGALRL